MNKEYVSYAESLNSIGDMIIKVSNLIPQLEDGKVHSKSELATYKEELTVASERYEFIVRELERISVPKIVTKEHGQLIDGVSSFVKGAKLMKKSLNIEDQSVNLLSYNQGDIIIEHGVRETEIASRSIGNKLIATSE